MFIRTKRLFLRPAWREDAPALSQLLADPGYQRDLTGSPWLETLADPDGLLSPQRGSGQVRLLIFRRTEGTPQLIGAAGLGRLFNHTEFGLWLNRAERRHGFAQEAGAALLSLAFNGLKLDSIWVPALQEGAAARLLARLGFRKAGKDGTLAALRANDYSNLSRLAA